jgi:SsrA-binding protein
MARDSSGGKKVITTNRKAYHEYHIEDTFEAGLALVGTEVKSVAAGKVNLSDSYCRLEEGEMYVLNMYINPYDPASRFNHDPRRRRKLLLHRWEINRIWGKAQQKGYTIIPLKIYFRNGKAKLEIALVKGKRLYDKRESIAERDMQRQAERELRG